MAEELKVLLLILDVVLVILIADWVSGLVHWTEVTSGKSEVSAADQCVLPIHG